MGFLGDGVTDLFTCVSSYSAAASRRNRGLAARLAGIGLAALLLGGCSAIGPFGELDRGSQLAANGGNARMIQASLTVSDTVDASDWETVRRTIARSSSIGSDQMDWNNPDTGTTGTVTVLAMMERDGAARCRPFTTTLNDARGIRHYRGEACLRTDGRWQLFGIKADDAKLL